MNNQRIPNETLYGNYVDGQILQHTDVNKMIDVLKTGINANYDDIKKMENGEKVVQNAASLNGLVATTFEDGTLDNDDEKLPTSKKVKQYVDNKVSEATPQKGVDYFTNAEVTQITNSIKSEVNNSMGASIEAAVNAGKSELDDYIEDLEASATSNFNDNYDSKSSSINSASSSALDDISDAKDDALSDIDSELSDAISQFNTNASNKTSSFNTNATSKTNSYNDNASSKLSAYNTNDENKTSAFNQNYSDKLSSFNTNAGNKQDAFDENASNKTNSFNSTADRKISILEQLIATIPDDFSAFTLDIVETLPSIGVPMCIYLVPNGTNSNNQNIYDEYLWLEETSRFEEIGKLQTSTDIDLSQYATVTDLASKQDKLTAGSNITIIGNTISAAGSGDMTKSVYDTNNSGVVDNAEKVNNHTVEKDVPANAQFTDTVYDDTEIRNILNGLSGVTLISGTSNSNPFILEDHKPGIYIFEDSTIYVRALSTNTSSTSLSSVFAGMLVLVRQPNSSTTSGTKLAYFSRVNDAQVVSKGSLNFQTNGSGISTSVTGTSFIKASGNQTVTGVKTFNSLPKSSVVPTNDDELVNKKYVDDNIPTMPTIVDDVTTDDATKVLSAKQGKTLKDLIDTKVSGDATVSFINNDVKLEDLGSEDGKYYMVNGYHDLEIIEQLNVDPANNVYNTIHLRHGDILQVFNDGSLDTFEDFDLGNIAFTLYRGNRYIEYSIDGYTNHDNYYDIEYYKDVYELYDNEFNNEILTQELGSYTPDGSTFTRTTKFVDEDCAIRKVVWSYKDN